MSLDALKGLVAAMSSTAGAPPNLSGGAPPNSSGGAPPDLDELPLPTVMQALEDADETELVTNIEAGRAQFTQIYARFRRRLKRSDFPAELSAKLRGTGGRRDLFQLFKDCGENVQCGSHLLETLSSPVLCVISNLGLCLHGDLNFVAFYT